MIHPMEVHQQDMVEVYVQCLAVAVLPKVSLLHYYYYYLAILVQLEWLVIFECLKIQMLRHRIP